jgi:hypothetical protein
MIYPKSRLPPRIKSGAGFFRITRYAGSPAFNKPSRTCSVSDSC